jgi:hypothetical protein
MTFHSINATDDDKKREHLYLDKIHRIIDWGLQSIETQKSKKRHCGKYQRFVRVEAPEFFGHPVRVVLDNLDSCVRSLTFRLILIRFSILRMKMKATLRTCERAVLVVLGKTELLIATSKFARAPPIAALFV